MKKVKKEKVRTTITLDKETHKFLKTYTALYGGTISDAIASSIDQSFIGSLKKLKKPTSIKDISGVFDLGPDSDNLPTRNEIYSRKKI